MKTCKCGYNYDNSFSSEEFKSCPKCGSKELLKSDKEGQTKLDTLTILDFGDVPESQVPEVDLNVFKSIIREELVLVRGMYDNSWRTFLALVFDVMTGEALDVKKVRLRLSRSEKIIIKPIGMLFDLLGEDLSKCKSADGNNIIFDETELTQKPS